MDMFIALGLGCCYRCGRSVGGGGGGFIFFFYNIFVKVVIIFFVFDKGVVFEGSSHV